MARKLQLPSRTTLGPLPGEPRVARLSVADFGSGLFGGWGMGGGHQGADATMARGMVYFPEVDTRREISAFTRTEILRKVRFLFANVGFCRRLVKGMARMVAGTGLMPRPQTGDRAWNKIALARFEAVMGSAATYDLSGKYNGYRAQRVKLGCRYKDGDIATVLTRGADGRATTALFEGHQIGSGKPAPGEEKTMYDGVKVDRHNRALSYRLLGDDNTQVDVPAVSCLLLADLERPGQARGLSILAHAVNHLLDRTEINAYFKGSIKNSSRMGYYIGAAKDTTPNPTPRPGGAAGNRRAVDLGGGQKVNIDRVFSSSGGEVQELDPGRELKILLDERPHPNTLGFLQELVRDISLGVDLSPEVLYNIVALGGSNVRYVMQDAQSFVESEQQILVDSDLGLEYIYFIADELASWRLPPCADPEWWKHDWITPARMTVDVGRDGKLYLAQLRSGALTFRRFFGWQGLGLDELDSWMDEYCYIRQGAIDRGLDPEIVLAAIYGRPSLPTVVSCGADTSAVTAYPAAP